MWNTQENNSKPNPEAYLKDYNQWPSGIYPINVTEAQNTKSNQYNTPHYRMEGGSRVHFQWSQTAFEKNPVSFHDKKKKQHLTNKKYK